MTTDAPRSLSRAWTRVARAVTALGVLAVLAVVVRDQVTLFAADSRSAFCLQPEVPGPLWTMHLLSAAPFVLMLLAGLISLLHRARRAFLVLDGLALVLLALYLAMSVKLYALPPVGDCAMDEWGDYGIGAWMVQTMIVWPFALIYLSAAAVLWLDARPLTGSPR